MYAFLYKSLLSSFRLEFVLHQFLSNTNGNNTDLTTTITNPVITITIAITINTTATIVTNNNNIPKSDVTITTKVSTFIPIWLAKIYCQNSTSSFCCRYSCCFWFITIHFVSNVITKWIVMNEKQQELEKKEKYKQLKLRILVYGCQTVLKTNRLPPTVFNTPLQSSQILAIFQLKLPPKLVLLSLVININFFNWTSFKNKRE